MDKEKKLKLQISFAAIALGLLLIALLYTIINYSNLWLALAGFGILTLADIFWIVNSVLSVMAIREAKRAEQYESIFKSEKASYLMLKKYSEEITERLQHLEKMINSPAAEIIKTQKSIAKVIISRERENAEALMNANDMLTEQLEALEKRMENSYSTMETKYEKISATNKDQIIAKQQEFIVALKDMELRLTSVMGQRVMAAPVMQAPVMPTAPAPVPVMAEPVMEEPAAAAEPVIEEPVVEEPTAAAEPVIEEPVVEEPTPEPEPVIEEPVIEEPVAEEAAPAPEMDDPNKKLSPDEIAAMFAAAEAADAPAEEPAAEPEPVAAEAPAAPEMDDPNKMMSPDDIAALISSMGAEPIPEPMTGEAEEAPAAEAPAEDTPPMPDLSDPNKKMSPDEIAALFANMG